jgi:XTP/dITP diphosphohydrolase
VTVKNEKEVKENWEKLKIKEGNTSVLGGVPNSLPSIIKACRIQEKAAGVGFDWTEKREVWAKVEEELSEFKTEETKLDLEKMEEEFGDVLFSLINYARFSGIDPDKALSKTNAKFIMRFQSIEQEAQKTGKNITDLSIEEMNEIWNRFRG